MDVCKLCIASQASFSQGAGYEQHFFHSCLSAKGTLIASPEFLSPATCDCSLATQGNHSQRISFKLAILPLCRVGKVGCRRGEKSGLIDQRDFGPAKGGNSGEGKTYKRPLPNNVFEPPPRDSFAVWRHPVMFLSLR